MGSDGVGLGGSEWSEGEWDGSVKLARAREVMEKGRKVVDERRNWKRKERRWRRGEEIMRGEAAGDVSDRGWDGSVKLARERRGEMLGRGDEGGVKEEIY